MRWSVTSWSCSSSTSTSQPASTPSITSTCALWPTTTTSASLWSHLATNGPRNWRRVHIQPCMYESASNQWSEVKVVCFFSPGHLQAVWGQVQGPEQNQHEEVHQRRQPNRRQEIQGRAVVVIHIYVKKDQKVTIHYSVVLIYMELELLFAVKSMVTWWIFKMWKESAWGHPLPSCVPSQACLELPCGVVLHKDFVLLTM